MNSVSTCVIAEPVSKTRPTFLCLFGPKDAQINNGCSLSPVELDYLHVPIRTKLVLRYGPFVGFIRPTNKIAASDGESPSSTSCSLQI